MTGGAGQSAKSRGSPKLTKSAPGLKAPPGPAEWGVYPRPSTLNPRPSTLNPRPSTLNPRHSSLDPSKYTLDRCAASRLSSRPFSTRTGIRNTNSKVLKRKWDSVYELKRLLVVQSEQNDVFDTTSDKTDCTSDRFRRSIRSALPFFLGVRIPKPSFVAPQF